MVVEEIAARPHRGGTLIDVGCGKARLLPLVRSLCESYIGVDIVRYDDFPPSAQFVKSNLDALPVAGLPDASAEVVVSIETIEHLENPRALMRELARLAKPGGLIVVTTPNQLSLLSLLTLLIKGQFNQFQEAPGLYPAHITHLLEVDMMRIARECGLVRAKVAYSNQGRMPYSARHWPSVFRGRWFSDNLMLAANKPGDGAPDDR